MNRKRKNGNSDTNTVGTVPIDDTDDSILRSCLSQVIREESPDETRN